MDDSHGRNLHPHPSALSLAPNLTLAQVGRNWVFHAEDRGTSAIAAVREWMAAIVAMLNELREARKEQEAAVGRSLLKGSIAATCTDTTGEWMERTWWEIDSSGQLRVLECEGGALLKVGSM